MAGRRATTHWGALGLLAEVDPTIRVEPDLRVVDDVIVTSGIGLRDAMLHSADLYPDSVFVGMNQSDEDSIPNFISVMFPEDQMGFLAGVLAVRLTQTGMIGAVCETSGIDSMWRYGEGFRAGANSTKESVEVIVVYRDDESRDKVFIDPEWGYATAQSLIEGGADVIFAAGVVSSLQVPEITGFFLRLPA